MRFKHNGIARHSSKAAVFSRSWYKLEKIQSQYQVAPSACSVRAQLPALALILLEAFFKKEVSLTSPSSARWKASPFSMSRHFSSILRFIVTASFLPWLLVSIRKSSSPSMRRAISTPCRHLSPTDSGYNMSQHVKTFVPAQEDSCWPFSHNPRTTLAMSAISSLWVWMRSWDNDARPVARVASHDRLRHQVLFHLPQVQWILVGKLDTHCHK